MTKSINVRGIKIGGGANVTVQSMTNTDTRDADATLKQIKQLAAAGADIVRISVYDEACVRNVRALVDSSPVPLVADIHFDHRLAVASIENGIDKVRINPGNIGGPKEIDALADCLKCHRVPVRVGVNAGSLSKDILSKHGGVTAQGMVESALEHAKLLSDRGYNDIALSIKASSVRMTVDANRLAHESCDYPLHLGVTEAGGAEEGVVKGAIGIGSLLLDGIGDTIRVSLTGDPVAEVYAGIQILRAVGLRRDYIEVISCPTCGRTSIDVENIALRVREATRLIKSPLKVAVMGCVVNGPGEAREADLGIAGGKDGGALFVKGEAPRAVHGDFAQILIDEILRMTGRGA